MKYTKFLSGSCILFACILSACGGNTSVHSSAEPENEMKMPEVLSLSHLHTMQGEEMLSSLGKEIKYIPLETTNSSLLRNVSKIALLKNGDMVISDNQSLFLFGADGRFIRPVSQQGNGPADYTRISALAANHESGGFFIQTNKKVVEFDAAGEYVTHFATEDRPMDMVVEAGGTVLLHRMNVLKDPADTTTTWHLFRYNQAGEEIKRLADLSPRLRQEGVMPMVMPMRPLYNYNGQVRFNEIGNDTIFTVEEERLVPYTVMDLGEMNMSTTPTGINGDQVMEELTKKLMLAFLAEDDQYLYMTFGWGFGGEYLYSTYNKKNGQLVNYGNGELLNTSCGLTNDLDGGLPFYPFVVTPTGTRIMWKNAGDFKEAMLEKDPEAGKQKYGDKFENAWQIAQSLDDEDNPVVILVNNE